MSRYTDRKQYFDEQVYTTEKYVIPFLEGNSTPFTSDDAVLEIGCGEGGNLKPFLDRGCRVVGIDMNAEQIRHAEEFFAGHPHRDRLTLIADDIYNVREFPENFRLVMMRDVIEHIHNQERFMSFVKRFLKGGAMMFIGFPPWQNPFGGHQQIAGNRILSRLPWIHLLPRRIYGGLMRLGGVDPEGLLEIKDTGLSIERLERIVRQENYLIHDEYLYFINPNYEVKFGLRPRRLWKFLNIPYLRNFYTTCVYYYLSPRLD